MKNFLIAAAGASLLLVSSITYATPSSFTVTNYTNCVCMPGHTCYQSKTVSAVNFYKTKNGTPSTTLPATLGASKPVPVATGESNCGSDSTCVISRLANSNSLDTTGPIDEPVAYVVSWQQTKGGPLASNVRFSFPTQCSK